MDPPYPNQMFSPPPPAPPPPPSSSMAAIGFGNDVQTWRETGFPTAGEATGYWNSRVPPPMTEAGLSRWLDC